MSPGRRAGPLSRTERAARVARIRGVYPIADDDPRWPSGPRAVIEAVLEAGASVVQLRLKQTPDGQALELARWAAALAEAHDALLIMNDRYDLADLAGAHGVHLGADDLPPEALPRAVRARMLVGLSTHERAQVEASRVRPVDYIGFGPVFETGSKRSEYSPRGTRGLRDAVRDAACPVVAIGGIEAKHLSALAETGAAAAAVISAIASRVDPRQALRELEGAWSSTQA